MNVERGGIGRLVLVSAMVVVVVVVSGGVFFYFGKSGGVSGTSSTQEIQLQFTGQQHLVGAGSTFVAPIMQTWTYEFQNLTHAQVTIDYGGGGSAAGISQLFGGLLDFAGSDVPVPSSFLAANATGRTLIQLPEALGSVAIFYNIPGIKQSLNLSGTILAQIYSQGVTKWNDPAIARLNPGIFLPDQTIVPVHRSDGSGTTYALTTYFSRVDPAWAQRIGVGVVVNWPNSPNSELAERGSGGVAGIVNQTTYSIGYADSFYAAYNGLKTAAIQNAAGNFIKPSVSSATAAAAADSAKLQANATYSITNAPGADSYPISTFTYLLVFSNQSTAMKADAITTFLWWVVHTGQSFSPTLYYAPLPSSVVAFDEGLIRQINYNGQTYVP